MLNERIIANALIDNGTPVTWPINCHLIQLGAMNYVTSTSTDSRFYGNLPKTLIDLNRSMRDSAWMRESKRRRT
jgi:hypothetical protein